MKIVYVRTLFTKIAPVTVLIFPVPTGAGENSICLKRSPAPSPVQVMALRAGLGSYVVVVRLVVVIFHLAAN